MKITNNQNLPKTLVNAITRHDHKSDADISVSQLLKSPREFWLAKRHSEEIEVDASSQIWALFGTAVHSIIEKGESKNALAEVYFPRIKVGKYTVSGTLDLYEDGYIHDWKTVSAWTLILMDESKKAEYISQLNSYAAFIRTLKFEVKGVKIHLIMRDWQSSKASFDASYPASQIQTVEFPLFTQEQTMTYIENRVDYLMSFKDVPDDELPLCSSKYRWAKPSKWALMKEGRKSAIKLFDNQDDAESEMTHMCDTKCYVEERRADEWKRCEYCSACKFCNQTQYEEKPARQPKEIKVAMSYERFLEVVNNG